MPVSDEERQRLYEEEKTREEIREQLRRERNEGKPKLTKSSEDKVLFGVAGGLAEHFNVDPLLVRLGFIVLSLGEGVGLLLYIALALIIPPQSKMGPNLIGIVVVAAILAVILGVMSSTVAILQFLF